MLPYIPNLVFVLFVSVFLNACVSRQEPAPVRGETLTKKPVRIIKEEQLDQGVQAPRGQKVALLLPLSGKHAPLGKAMQQAAELGLFEKADDQIELAIYDTRSTPEGARQAGMLAVQNQAGIILGPIFAEEVKAVGEVARYHNVNVLSFSNNRAVVGNGVFALGFSPEEQIQAILTYAARHGLRNIAILSPHSTYGQLLDQEALRLQQQGQIQVAETIRYSSDLQNPNKELNPLKSLKYDALFIPEGGHSLNQVLAGLNHINIKMDGIKLLGTGQWDEPETLQNPRLIGAWIAAPDPAVRHIFDEKFLNAYGEPAPRLASLAYDAVAMVSILKKHYADNPYGMRGLTQTRGFDVSNGVFRLKQDGTVERKLAILEVTPAGLKMLQKPSATF
jgi:branched-chain amino acid transport system substrate-binding protein